MGRGPPNLGLERAGSRGGGPPRGGIDQDKWAQRGPPQGGPNQQGGFQIGSQFRPTPPPPTLHKTTNRLVPTPPGSGLLALAAESG